MKARALGFDYAATSRLMPCLDYLWMRFPDGWKLDLGPNSLFRTTLS
jgi:hypothetical protein